MRKENCTLELYDPEVRPCSKAQAAAVYCWTDETAIDVRIDKINVKENGKFGIYFKMFDVKYGRYYNTLDGAISTPPDPLDFSATQCGVLVKRYKYESTANKGQMLVSGKMADGCEECVKLHYLTATFFAAHICPGEVMELEADWQGANKRNVTVEGTGENMGRWENGGRQ